MPNRYLREGWLRSEAIQGLDMFTRDFYVRLLLVVDDFGCYDGRPAVVRSFAYPTFGPEYFEQQVSAQEGAMPTIEEMLDTLHADDLIVRYANKGRPYLAITQWKADYRGERKFPAPPVDIDLPYTAALRGHFGRPIGWNNPHGSDPVSILIGIDGRAVTPQPPEWRDPNDWAPITMERKDRPAVTGKPKTGRPMTGTPVTTRTESVAPKQGVVTACQDIDIEQSLDKDAPSALPPSLMAHQSLASSDQDQNPPTPTPTDRIELNGQGGWHGVTEEQQVRWQSMFSAMSIPDQLDRAAAWLEVNAGERDAIRAQGGGFGPFLVRWLLREARDKPIATIRTRGAID